MNVQELLTNSQNIKVMNREQVLDGLQVISSRRDQVISSVPKGKKRKNQLLVLDRLDRLLRRRLGVLVELMSSEERLASTQLLSDSLSPEEVTELSTREGLSETTPPAP